MGRLITFLTILICIDLLFIITGQLTATGPGSLGSLLVTTILDLPNATGSGFFTELIGNLADLFDSTTGLAALIAAGATAIIAGIAFRQSDTILFIPIAFTFAIMSSDFIFIYSYLASLNFVLATLIMGPTFVMYVITVLEWLRGKD